ncbi:MAG: HAD family acid phosphatase [Candidatus Korarchaeum sp.]
MRCAVFDIDNTLFDARARYRVAVSFFNVSSHKELPFNEQREFWRKFLDPELFCLDTPIGRSLEMVLDAKRRGLRVVLITGRYESLRRDTELQLLQAGVPYDQLLMRPDGNFQRDRELKITILRKLNCEVVEYHDDDLETLLEVRKVFPKALLLLHRPDGSFEIIR